MVARLGRHSDYDRQGFRRPQRCVAAARQHLLLLPGALHRPDTATANPNQDRGLNPSHTHRSVRRPGWRLLGMWYGGC
eukprot:42933-Chlamydomonas_euryale.AAC.1